MTKESHPSSKMFFAFLALCIAGLAAAIELTWIHVQTHTDPSFHSVCAIKDTINCETVALSPWSVFAGLPVSVWGIIGYTLMGLLALWGAFRIRLHDSWPVGILFVLSLFSVLCSLFLAFISLTRIDSICLFCFSTYAINAGLLIVSWGLLKERSDGMYATCMNDLQSLLKHRWILALIVLIPLAAIITLELSVDSYWAFPEWTKGSEIAQGRSLKGGHSWIGAEKPKVTIVEFSDYQCPFCRKAHKAIREIISRYPTQVRLVHRQLPLDHHCNPNIARKYHEYGCLFAEAAECAALHGQFWKMNDALFFEQDRIKAKDIDVLKLAVRFGIDRSSFEECLENHLTMPQLLKDIREAKRRGVQGTPTFFMDKHVYVGGIPEHALQSALTATP